ncbi:probable glycosyltransferase At5g20260 at C-terminar half [Coccomyxa sp. Obi]|nr:probable glycosyltransferase At5g20260 at C-terminar half [Coccomyxa sp. Obi]
MARDPKLERIYVPIHWTDLLHKAPLLIPEAQVVLDGLNPSFQYFSVSQLARGLAHPSLNLTIPKKLDFILFSSGGSSRPLRTVLLPLLKQELVPEGLSKTISVSFQGASSPHDLRGKIAGTLRKSFLFLNHSADWKVILESSNFSICPRGFGSTSFRLAESIQLGTIPIYVWQQEAWLPYQRMLNWSEFAIVISSQDIAELPDMVKRADVTRMQEALREVQHMFTYNYTIEYILRKAAAFT